MKVKESDFKNLSKDNMQNIIDGWEQIAEYFTDHVHDIPDKYKKQAEKIVDTMNDIKFHEYDEKAIKRWNKLYDKNREFFVALKRVVCPEGKSMLLHAETLRCAPVSDEVEYDMILTGVVAVSLPAWIIDRDNLDVEANLIVDGKVIPVTIASLVAL